MICVWTEFNWLGISFSVVVLYDHGNKHSVSVRGDEFLIS
jgi:hypothetical protein